jgi:hypothetical protein
MATLTLQVDDELLAKAAAAAARTPGRTLEGIVVAHLNEIIFNPVSEQRAAFNRLVELADERGFCVEGMPLTSDQRNER